MGSCNPRGTVPLNEYELHVAVKIKFAAFGRKDAQVRVNRIGTALTKLAGFAQRTWGIEVESEVGTPVKRRRIVLPLED